MHDKRHHIELEKEWLEGKISSEEMLEKMGRADEIVTLIRSGEQAAKWNVPEKRSKEEIWSFLVDKVKQEPETKVIPLHRRTWIISVAASIVLLLGAFFVFKSVDNVRYKTKFGETASFRLPDNSVVTLNAGSALRYSKRSWKHERSLSLKGEAFFEVQKGSNFEVNTRLGKVEVLGTSFNVRAYGKKLTVACKTGKVRVTDELESTHTITPGLKVKTSYFEKTLEEPEPISLEKIDIWREGEFEYESMFLEDVLSEMERQFDIEIEFDELREGERTSSGYFNKNNLREGLDVLSISMKLEYEIKGDKVIIKNKTN